VASTNHILNGVRILTFTTGYAGPYAGRLLASYGAEVIKIESRKGGLDTFRHYGQHKDIDAAPRFIECNLGVRSMAINLKHPTGARLVRDHSSSISGATRCSSLICSSVQISQASRCFTFVEIQKHDHENDEDHDRTRVDQNLHGGDERRGECDVDARQRQEHPYQGDGAVERILVIHHRDRTCDGESGEEKK